jgi:hypothetical protein
MTVRSALRALRKAGAWSVQSRADGTYLARLRPPKGKGKYGVLSRLYFAGCLETALNANGSTKRSKRREKP